MQNYLTCILLFMPLLGYSQKVAVVDVQKVFDGYTKVKEARERLEKSSSIAKEEIDIFKDELGKIKITEDRIDPYYGTHTVTYESDIDRISLEHHAKSREGFALGAIIASEWIIGKTGVFSMRDVLNL